MLSIIRSLSEVLSGDRRRYAWFLISFFVVAIFEVAGVGAIPLFIALLNDPQAFIRHRLFPESLTWLRGYSSQGLIMGMGSVLILFFLAKNLVLAIAGYFQARFIAIRQSELSSRMFASYLYRPYTFHLQRNTAELVRNTIGVTFTVFSGVVIPGCVLLTETTVVVLVGCLLLATNPVPTLLAGAILGGLSLLFYGTFKSKVRELGERQQTDSAEMIKWINQGLGGIKETKILGCEPFFIDTFSKHIESYSRANTYFQVIGALPRYFIESVVVISIVAVIFSLLAHGESIASIFTTLVLFGAAAVRLMPSVNRILGMITSIRYNQFAVEVVRKDLADARQEGMIQRHTRDAERLNFSTAVELRDVSFAYPGTDRQVLKKVSLRIPKGRMVAFVGRSGAGKSTLVDMILGLYAPSSGCVLVDGHDLKERTSAWQQTIGYVPQAIYITDDTIRRNVAFGLDDKAIDDAKVWNALHHAQLTEFVTELPGQLDTFLGERGSRLSGGQRQRIGIARALYHDPQIVIMDEATSALDTPTEYEIAQVFQHLAGVKTVIIIAHRISTVRHCQYLFVLQNGELTAEGDYNKLAAANHHFQTLIQ